MYLFTAAYGMSYGPIGWILPSEVFPLSMRSKGVALSTASNWFNNCACCGFSYQYLLVTHDHSSDWFGDTDAHGKFSVVRIPR